MRRPNSIRKVKGIDILDQFFKLYRIVHVYKKSQKKNGVKTLSLANLR